MARSDRTAVYKGVTVRILELQPGPPITALIQLPSGHCVAVKYDELTDGADGETRPDA